MILDPGITVATRQSRLVAHLSHIIESACGDEFLEPHAIEQMAGAVEDFIEDGRTSFLVDSDHALVLASRALDSMGHGMAAKRLLLHGTGLVRPTEWIAAGSDAVWVLDLRRMTVTQDAGLELVFFAGLRLVLESMAEVWDPEQGRGVLGLLHVCSTAQLLMGTDVPQQVIPVAGEMVDHCGQLLTRIGEQRKWRSVPRVMNLDML
ncbi:MAG: hypothetical protein A2498_08765 [Lentisphaerae bacterium RIFOXYC12_FULL_60_16]|nr:MAG: hypothetical protein A2498_08765 [Lentisphaerae bacterium RIFOXYC12_FULL_60_16]OGV74788.1 MAG: hypothetical protein A2269_04550 [Lentisphaerae bacterium RIFOXYA12_FULL_60_10]OGV81016.1 MAG: hypothetical protein A2340_07125 [Lentisphaerae bacterium RIFOXYB12_FULL_60_10]